MTERVAAVAVVAVLQFQNNSMKKSKLNSIFIYKYRSIFWVGERLFENCNTATTATKRA